MCSVFVPTCACWCFCLAGTSWVSLLVFITDLKCLCISAPAPATAGECGIFDVSTTVLLLLKQRNHHLPVVLYRTNIRWPCHVLTHGKNFLYILPRSSSIKQDSVKQSVHYLNLRHLAPALINFLISSGVCFLGKQVLTLLLHLTNMS